MAKLIRKKQSSSTSTDRPGLTRSTGSPGEQLDLFEEEDEEEKPPKLPPLNAWQAKKRAAELREIGKQIIADAIAEHGSVRDVPHPKLPKLSKKVIERFKRKYWWRDYGFNIRVRSKKRGRNARS